MMSKRESMQGFSLIEMIVAIVVMAIVSIGVVQYIGFSAAGYVDTANRNQLSAAGRLAIDRMALELHNALPNSVRLSAVYAPSDPLVLTGDAFAGDQCLEFLPVLSASTYIDPPFAPMADTTFSTVRFEPDQEGVGGAFAAIYPVNTSELYGAPNPGPITALSSLAHLDANRDQLEIAGFAFLRRSPVERIYLTGGPVSFCVNGSRLYRYSGGSYGLGLEQRRPAAPDGICPLASCLPATTPGRMLIATDVDNAGLQAFDQQAATRRRNAIVQFQIRFSRAGESVLINHEVMLRNAP